jgi:uncharacterized surface protein with fasciclin (FAS1) repeats
MRKLAPAFVAATFAATALAASASTASAASGPTIVDVAVDASGGGSFDSDHGDFDILVQAVVATGLDGFLSGKGQHTVFAPTDQAFLDLTGATTESAAFDAAVALLGVDGVRDVVSYHVAPGKRLSGDVVDATRIRTVTRSFITKDAGSTVLTDGSGNDVQIIAVDIPASNGVIHVIDSVLLP